jgi:hypothetical protein
MAHYPDSRLKRTVRYLGLPLKTTEFVVICLKKKDLTVKWQTVKSIYMKAEISSFEKEMT